MGEIVNLLLWLAVVAFLAVPAIWMLKRIWSRGIESLHIVNLPSTVMSLLFIAPGVAMVYYFQTDQPVLGLIFLVLYGWLVWNSTVWSDIFTDLNFGQGSGDPDTDIVRRGARVVDAAQMPVGINHGDGADVVIGGVTIPRTLEAQHFLISGTTGAGKTQVINGMLRSIRKRGHRAVIADPAGGFYARFGQPGDVLVNPFDKRSVQWSPFAEVRADYDCESPRVSRRLFGLSQASTVEA